MVLCMDIKKIWTHLGDSKYVKIFMIFHILREILKKQVDDVANLANNFTIFLEAILNAFGSFFFF